MHIGFYFKNKLKNRIIFSLAAAVIFTISIFCISFHSQKTSPSEEFLTEIKLPVIMYHMILQHPKNTLRKTLNT